MADVFDDEVEGEVIDAEVQGEVIDDEVEGEPTISIKDYLEAVEEEELVSLSHRVHTNFNFTLILKLLAYVFPCYLIVTNNLGKFGLL